MTDFAALATSLLEKLGTTVTIRRYTGGGIDPVTGEKSHQLQEDFTVNGAWQKTSSYIVGEGARIENGKKVLVIDSTVQPLITDKLRVASEDWSINDIEMRQHKDSNVVYFLTVTK